MTLILASASPRRRALLRSMGFRFVVKPSHVSEATRQKNPRLIVRELALRKARAAARPLKSGVVLGADTIVVLGKDILGKPRDAREAYRMLYRLSGTTHRVFTGVAVVDALTGKYKVDYAVSKVRMKKMDLARLMRLSRRHLDKAGSYAIQETNDPIARVASGSYDNVVGLPRRVVRRLLRGFRKHLS